MCQVDRSRATIAKIHNSFTITNDQTALSPLRVLLVSENVAPQVNGIARRVTHYADGLKELGCDVDLLCPESIDESTGQPAVLPFINPWNFTAKMFVIRPKYFMNLVLNKSSNYDVVHIVLPANISGCLLLSALRIARVMSTNGGPSLVISWHCNLIDYTAHILPGPIVSTVKFLGTVAAGILPSLADRLLTPTQATEPVLTSLFKGRSGKPTHHHYCITANLVFTRPSLQSKQEISYDIFISFLSTYFVPSFIMFILFHVQESATQECQRATSTPR